jgi:hypothetical protein
MRGTFILAALTPFLSGVSAICCLPSDASQGNKDPAKRLTTPYWTKKTCHNETGPNGKWPAYAYVWRCVRGNIIQLLAALLILTLCLC